jgi:hypothetical protein
MVNASSGTNSTPYAYNEQQRTFYPWSKPDPEATHSSRNTAYIKKAWSFGLLTNTSLWYDSQEHGEVCLYVTLIYVLEMYIRSTSEVWHTIIRPSG